VLVSIIISTARQKNGLVAYPNKHHIEFTLGSLRRQHFKDFEVIISDAIHSVRDLEEEIDFSKYPFPVKVAKPTSVFLDEGLWSSQATRNAGASLASGNYFLFADDCAFFPASALRNAMDVVLTKGWMPNFLCHRTNGRRLIDAVSHEPTKIRTYNEAKSNGLHLGGMDSRLGNMQHDEKFGVKICKPANFYWQHHYAFNFVTREDFEYVNGYDENFDGEKSMDDVELGSRLQMAGRLRSCLIENVYVYEEYQNHVDPSVFKNMEGYSIKMNNDLLWLMRIKEQWRANSTLYSDEELSAVMEGRYSGDPHWIQRLKIRNKANEAVRDLWRSNVVVKELVTANKPT